jgi:phosphoserine phosphatase
MNWDNTQKKIYCFDLDGTLCKWNLTDEFPKGRAEDAVPYPKRIQKVNSLYDRGHHIIIDTARGSNSTKERKGTLVKLTKTQLKEWGVKHHELRVGTKTFADFYIDDRAVSDEIFFSSLSKKI